MIETWSTRTPGGERVPGKRRAAAFYALLTVALTYPLSIRPSAEASGLTARASAAGQPG
jgi:hypothetical protein